MTLLTPTGITGTVAWLGLVRGHDGIAAEAVPALVLDWGGPVGDVHHGLTRPSCVRVRRQYPRGTEIRNARQLSILSAEEMAQIAAALGLPRLAPEWLGASVVLEGLPDLTRLPTGSRLMAEGDGGPALVTDTENAPCRYPAERIDRAHPGLGAGFVAAAQHRRGITAAVERPGTLALGQVLRVHLPPRHEWNHG